METSKESDVICLSSLRRRVQRYASTTNGAHRYGVGKHFLVVKQVYAEDGLSSRCCLDEGSPMQRYLTNCIDRGLELQKIELAEFNTKNGGRYSGFRATEDIHCSDVLMKVPKSLILDTPICLFSDIQVVVKENLKFFSARKDGSLLEDIVMLVFLLRQVELGENSPWRDLLVNLSRDIDTVDFWEEQEIAALEDQRFTKRIRVQRKYFKYILENMHVPTAAGYSSLPFTHAFLSSSRKFSAFTPRCSPRQLSARGTSNGCTFTSAAERSEAMLVICRWFRSWR